MPCMKETPKNLEVVHKVLVVEHCLLPTCLKCGIYSTKELDPTPDHILCFSYACASHEEIAPPTPQPPCSLVSVRLVAYLKGRCFKMHNFINGRTGY